MRTIKLTCIFFIFLTANVLSQENGQKPYYYRGSYDKIDKDYSCDVAVYGGTPSGVTAAIQAARMGKKTILISFDNFVGGLTSGGLTATDIGHKNSIGGIAMEFYKRVGQIKDFSPAKAEEVYLKMLKEAGVRVLLQRPLISILKENNKIISLKLDTGETLKALIFIDSSYEGDLMATANVSYTVGREPAAAYGESLGGQWQKESWKGVYQFCNLPVSPFIKPGDPESGLLIGISDEPPGKPGDGDNRVQAYNFRMYLSKKENRIPFKKPRNYNPQEYDLLARFMTYKDIKWTLNYTTSPMTDGPVQMRIGDSNNAGSYSTDYVGGNYKWPDGTYSPESFSELPAPRRGLPVSLKKLYEIREKIYQNHVRYQQGLLYFLSSDERVPEELRNRVQQFGLDPDEFKETNHWPHALYVREGRRMVSEYVMTQANCESKRKIEDSIGMGSYALDSHFCQRVVIKKKGVLTVRNEGGFGKGLRKPYPISYRSIVPKKNECTNLLVGVCLSASHVAYGSIRMEPVFMILGQSAGTAASIAIDKVVAVQDVEYEDLKDQLIKGKQKL